MGNIRAPLTPITDEELPDNLAGADVLKSNSIEAKHIKAGSITTDKLAVGAVTADKITLSIDDIPDGNTYGRIKKVTINADGLVLLDETVDGNYAKILKTDVQAGHVYISSVTNFANGYNPAEKANKGAVNTYIRSLSQPTTRPDGSSLEVGDIWIDKAHNDHPYVWDGSVWATAFTQIDGGHIITGIISAGNGVSKINLDDGTFNFGSGALTFDGSTLQVVGNIRSSSSTGERIEINTNNELGMFDSSGNEILSISASDNFPFFNFAAKATTGSDAGYVYGFGNIHVDSSGNIVIFASRHELQLSGYTKASISVGSSSLSVDASGVHVDLGKLFLEGGYLYTDNGTHLYWVDSSGNQTTIV